MMNPDHSIKLVDELRELSTNATTAAVVSAADALIAAKTKLAEVFRRRQGLQRPAIEAGAREAAKQTTKAQSFVTHEDRVDAEQAAATEYQERERRRIAESAVGELRPRLDNAAGALQDAVRAFREHKARREATLSGPAALREAKSLQQLLQDEHARAELESWGIGRIAGHARHLLDAGDVAGFTGFYRVAVGRVAYFADTPPAARAGKTRVTSAGQLTEEQRIARSLQVTAALAEDQTKPEDLKRLGAFEEKLNELWRVLVGFDRSDVLGMTTADFWKYAATVRDPWAVKPDWPLKHLTARSA